MTELLKKAIAQIEKLPIEEQNAIASRWLAEIEDEQAWQSRFQATGSPGLRVEMLQTIPNNWYDRAGTLT